MYVCVYVRKNYQNVCMYILMHVCKNVRMYVCLYVLSICLTTCNISSFNIQIVFMLDILWFFKNLYTNFKLHQNHTKFCFNTHVLL